MERTFQRWRWLTASLVAAGVALFLQFVQPAPLSWRYDHGLVMQGEVWRLVSGTWVHLSALHLLMNMCGLALVLALFRKVVLPLKVLGLLTLIGALSHVVLLAYPVLGWVVGLSGALHGLFVYYTLTYALIHAPRLAFMLLAGLGLKLLLEAALNEGASTWLGGYRVAWPSHWAGAAAGVVTAAAVVLVKRFAGAGRLSSRCPVDISAQSDR